MKLVRTLALASLAFAAFAVSSASDAHAQGKGGAKKAAEVYEIGPVIVTARPTRPSAVVELGKILPEIEIAKIRKDFFTKIEEAISGEPF